MLFRQVVLLVDDSISNACHLLNRSISLLSKGGRCYLITFINQIVPSLFFILLISSSTVALTLNSSLSPESLISFIFLRVCSVLLDIEMGLSIEMHYFLEIDPFKTFWASLACIPALFLTFCKKTAEDERKSSNYNSSQRLIIEGLHSLKIG